MLTVITRDSIPKPGGLKKQTQGKWHRNDRIFRKCICVVLLARRRRSYWLLPHSVIRIQQTLKINLREVYIIHVIFISFVS